MELEDFIDIYDSIDSYVDPLVYPKYGDFSKAVSNAFNYSVRSLLKEQIREIWDNYWDDIDPDGSLRDYYNSL